MKASTRRAPITMKIHPDKIREVIGKGGSVIRSITEETGANDRHQRRRQSPSSPSVNREAAGDAAKKRIEQRSFRRRAGPRLRGQGRQLMDPRRVRHDPSRARTVSCTSQISNEHVEKVSDKLKEGDIVKVKVPRRSTSRGRIRPSMKALEEEGAA